jgi:hypothetical protein
MRDIGDSKHVEGTQRPDKREIKTMFQLILALTFIGMILTPAVVAAFSGKKEFEAETEETPAAQPVRREVKTARVAFEAATLPMRGTLGMAGR